MTFETVVNYCLHCALVVVNYECNKKIVQSQCSVVIYLILQVTTQCSVIPREYVQYKFFKVDLSTFINYLFHKNVFGLSEWIAVIQ